jgi:general secretion pathway protein G
MQPKTFDRRLQGGPRARRAFTLIELLIVVTILGILAAILIPQFTTASAEARINAYRSQVQQLRNVITLYKTQHGDQLPDLLTNWDPLIKSSTYNGKTFGPYLQQMPRNLMNQLNTVADGNPDTPTSSRVGFIYDYNGGTGTGALGGTDVDGVTPFK